MLAPWSSPLAGLSAQQQRMLEALQFLVESESPSTDLAGLTRCAEAVRDLGRELLGVDPRLVTVGGREHLHWRGGGDPRVLLLGHFDTVWPVGTLGRLPFRTDAGRAFGPGVFDMKAGVVQGLFALASLASPCGVAFLLTSHEEL